MKFENNNFLIERENKGYIIPYNKNNLISKKRSELNKYKIFLFLNQYQRDIIVGCILGDLHIRKIGKYSHLVFEQKNKEYLLHLYYIFKNYVRLSPKERLQRRLISSNLKSTWYFWTISHVDFEYYRNKFYILNKKIIPNDLNKLLTLCALAYWYMDDGTKRSNISYGLSTCSFSEEEHYIIINALLKNFNIQAKMLYQGNYKILVISKKYSNNNSHLIFRALIKPYIIDSMLYKL